MKLFNITIFFAASLLSFIMPASAHPSIHHTGNESPFHDAYFAVGIIACLVIGFIITKAFGKKS